MKYTLFFVLFSLFSVPLFAQDKCLSGDCENGFGKMECECGYTFEGTFKNGEKVEGVLIKKELTYEGQFKDDIAHGKGKITYKDGSWYAGDFAFNQPDGFGEYHMSNGFVYRGQMKEGNFYGWGAKTQTFGETGDSLTYFGWFEADELNGAGAFIHPNGFTYLGFWESGKQTGYGLTIQPDSTFEAGIYKRGKISHSFTFNSTDQQSITYELDSETVVFKYDSKTGNYIIKERSFESDYAFEYDIEITPENTFIYQKAKTRIELSPDGKLID